MGLRRVNRDQVVNLKEVSFRRNETFMKVAGRLLREYEKSANESLALEAQKLLEFAAEDLQIRNSKLN